MTQGIVRPHFSHLSRWLSANTAAWATAAALLAAALLALWLLGGAPGMDTSLFGGVDGAP